MIGSQVAERQADGGHSVTVLTLRRDVARHPLGKPFGMRFLRQVARRPRGDFVGDAQVVHEQRPTPVVRQDGAFLQYQAPELLHPQLGDQELEACPCAVLLFSQPCEDPAHRLGQRQDFFLGNEFIQQLRLVRHGPQAAADVEREAALQLAVPCLCLGNEAHVVHVRQAATLVRAAGKSDLDLAAEVLGVLVVQQEVRQGVSIRGDVEAFVVADAGHGAGRYVAYHIAARLLRGDAHRCQTPHQVGGVVDVDEMELEVLPRRDVADGIRIFLRQVGQGLHLFGVEPAKGDLDALHAGRVPHRMRSLGVVPARVAQLPGIHAIVSLAVIVALPVNPAPQSRFGENLVVNLVLALQRQLRLENVDFLLQGHRQATRQAFLPNRGGHYQFP